jgi:hypothetical protein
MPLETDGIQIMPTNEKGNRIDIVQIDFTRDNVLPELNAEDLAELDKESKPVLLKKEILKRNLKRHPEVNKEDYETILRDALYNSDIKFHGKSCGHSPNYINFVKIRPHNNSLVLLELAEHKESFEVIHLFRLGDNSLERMQSKK